MEKLIKKIDDLKKAIDEDVTVCELRKLNDEIKSHEKLMNLLNSYHNDFSDDTKEKIIQNEKFRKYKEKETEINLLIFEINSKLKQIIKKDKCNL